MIFCVPKVYLQNTTKAEREARLQGAFNWDYSNLAFSVNTHTHKQGLYFVLFFLSFIQILVVRETDKNNDLSVSLS